MTGEAFLSLALQLASSDAEERLRTSVSRAYFGAYHVVRDFVQTCDVIVPKRDVHNKLQWCLQQAGDALGEIELAKAGSKLGSLQTDRNRADYDLSDQSFSRRANVVKAAKKAQEVAVAIARYANLANQEMIRPHIRGFAKQELWQVR